MKKSIYLKFCIFLILASILISILFKPTLISYFDEGLVFTLCLIFVVNFVIFLSATNRFFKNKLRFDVLFLLGFLIVHFQIPFFASIGIEPEDGGEIWINKNVVNYGVWLSTMAGQLWMLGYLLFLNRQGIIKKAQSLSSINFIKINTKPIDLLILFLFIIFIGVVGSAFLSGAYSGVRNWGEGATYVYLLLSSLICLRIIYIFINDRLEYKKKSIFNLIKKNKLFIVILFIYSMIFFLASDRGEIMTLGLIALGGYSLFHKTISTGRLLLLLVGGAIVFSILQMGRSGNVREVSEQNIIARGLNELSSWSELNPTYELAKSNSNLFRALDNIPESHPYLYGVTHFSNIISVVPFAGPTIRSSIGIPFQYSSTTTLFSFWDQGFDIRSGVGTEIVADVYVNYGIIGTFIVFFLFGYFISFLQYRATFNSSHITILVYLVLLASSFYMNRSTLFDPLKTLFYILFFDYLFRTFLRKKIVLYEDNPLCRQT